MPAPLRAPTVGDCLEREIWRAQQPPCSSFALHFCACCCTGKSHQAFQREQGSMSHRSNQQLGNFGWKCNTVSASSQVSFKSWYWGFSTMPILAWIAWQLLFVNRSNIDRMVLFERWVISFFPQRKHTPCVMGWRCFFSFWTEAAWNEILRAGFHYSHGFVLSGKIGISYRIWGLAILGRFPLELLFRCLLWEAPWKTCPGQLLAKSQGSWGEEG